MIPVESVLKFLQKDAKKLKIRERDRNISYLDSK